MSRTQYYVFPDAEDWIVFSPAEGRVFRTNEAAAAQLWNVPWTDATSVAESGRKPVTRLQPNYVTIACSNRCGQACVYCYGTPIHENPSVLDPGFCRAALQWMVEHKAPEDNLLHAFFHGVGEPTYYWKVFRECVEVVREIESSTGVRFVLHVCTGGQLEPEKASFIAEHFDEVHISLDGPPDIQNRQKPRRDGRDSFSGPFRLAKEVLRAGKQVILKSTVTAESVSRMTESVEFVAREIGKVRLQLGMVYHTPYCDRTRFGMPDWHDYVRGFGEAFQKGLEFGVNVQHPSVHLDMLVGPRANNVVPHFCLAPPNIVTAFYDVPADGPGNPQEGCYGHYDRTSGRLQIDEEKCLSLPHAPAHPRCASCPCLAACGNVSGVKGRMPDDEDVLEPVCNARRGVLREMLSRMVPRRHNQTTETIL